MLRAAASARFRSARRGYAPAAARPASRLPRRSPGGASPVRSIGASAAEPGCRVCRPGRQSAFRTPRARVSPVLCILSTKLADESRSAFAIRVIADGALYNYGEEKEFKALRGLPRGSNPDIENKFSVLRLRYYNRPLC